MKIVGYTDRLSVEPGQRIDFMVSCELPRFRSRLVRLIHGDANPKGPGFKAEPVNSTASGEHIGKYQPLSAGSYVRIPSRAALAITADFSVHLWLYATTPDQASQTLISMRGTAGEGFALQLDGGVVSLQVGVDQQHKVSLSTRLRPKTWYALGVAFDAKQQSAILSLIPRDLTQSLATETKSNGLQGSAAVAKADLLIAAEALVGRTDAVGRFYNGRIDSPKLFGRALSIAALRSLSEGQNLVDGLIATWDFSKNISTSKISDTGPNELHGRTVQKPMRGATGHNWDGSEVSWLAAPQQYGSIHFHDDDLDDAGWAPCLSWIVPGDLPSGFYALHVYAESGDEDYLPFAVRPQRGTATASIAFLMPTFSYLAYANEHMMTGMGGRMIASLPGYPGTKYPWQPQDAFIMNQRLMSLYDEHSDGSPATYASWRRPLVNLRPKYHMPLLHFGRGSPHQLVADLCIVDWLTEHQYRFDVIADENLHVEGQELLDHYKVIITGAHPEYWSEQMIRAAQAYLRNGGRLMYLGGNGMFWVTQLDADSGHTVEIRRLSPCTRGWEMSPGDGYLSTTGERGGLWRYRGLGSQRWLGVICSGAGSGPGRPYERQPDSFDPKASWIFKGIGANELIGDLPCLIQEHGAGGFELDCVYRNLEGTPAHTLLLASTTRFDDSYGIMHENLMNGYALPGSMNPDIRGDLALLLYGGGGAVFSTGSISWSGCLHANGYDNTAARVTQNVLDGFLGGELPASDPQ